MCWQPESGEEWWKFCWAQVFPFRFPSWELLSLSLQALGSALMLPPDLGPCPVLFFPEGPGPSRMLRASGKPQFSTTTHCCFLFSGIVLQVVCCWSMKTELIWSLQMPQSLAYSLELIQGYFYLNVPVKHLCFMRSHEVLGTALWVCTNCHLLFCCGICPWAALCSLPSSREGRKAFLSWWYLT